MSRSSVDNQAKPPSPETIVLVLCVLAVLCAAFGSLLALAMVAADLETHSLTFARMLLAVTCLLGGLAVAGILWAAVWVIRRVQHFTAVSRPARAGDDLPMTPPPVPREARGEETLRHILHELREMSSRLIHSPRTARVAKAEPFVPSDKPTCPAVTVDVSEKPGQNEKIEKSVNDLKAPLAEGAVNTAAPAPAESVIELTPTLSEEMLSATARAIEACDFAKARSNLDGMTRDVPDDPRLVDLRSRLAQAMQSALEEELKLVSRQTMDLMAVSAFVEAQKLSDGLLTRFPDSDDVKVLVEHVRREAASFTSEQRRRMYREVEVHAENRRWRQAVTSANRFLQAYPAGAEADLIRVQMPTMQTNATIEEVRDLRDRILDYMERRRYLEAIELSRDVINRFPKTAAAEELRQQLPRLLELARTNPSVR